MQTVRDATFDVLRRHGLTTIFANPGSTEIPFLTGFPEDLRFVLGLHEGSVVGAATGFALAMQRPALALLHTTAGLGNAVSALATARVNRAPLVVLVGQQDRRHLALEPFLAGHLTGLAGSYPVHVDEPVRAQDVPGAVARAWHRAREDRGPALVVVPMDDWHAAVDEGLPVAAPRHVRRPAAAACDEDIGEMERIIDEAAAPGVVVGAGADSPETWEALVRLTERLGCPVWQEPFGARAGFPQDHPLFAGHLPPARSALRAALAEHDAIVVVGAAAFRQYPYEPGPLLTEGTRLAVVTDDPAEAHRSPAAVAVIGDPAHVCAQLVTRVRARDSTAPRRREYPATPPPPRAGEPLRPQHVFAALAERLPRDAVLIEESPSSRPDLHAMIPARLPMGFLSAAMGGLGFALPAAVGVGMASERPVVTVAGDGAALYGIQSLWTAAHYGVGVLVIVLANGGYAVMDQLAETRGGGKPVWPGFEEIRVAGLARSLGCDAIEVEHFSALELVLEEVLPSLAERSTPLLLDVAVAP